MVHIAGGASATIEIGTRLKNNDPRKNGEIITVTYVTKDCVWYHTGKRKAKIALDRIYPSNKVTARGYSLVID